MTALSDKIFNGLNAVNNMNAFASVHPGWLENPYVLTTVETHRHEKRLARLRSQFYCLTRVIFDDRARLFCVVTSLYLFIEQRQDIIDLLEGFKFITERLLVNIPRKTHWNLDQKRKWQHTLEDKLLAFGL